MLRNPLGEIFLLVTGLLMALCVVSPALAQDGAAEVRMIHLSPDAPDVMVELDGEPVDALADVGYGDASPYLEIPAGPHEISVFATPDASEPVLEVDIAPEAGSSYTIAGVGLLADDTFGATLFEDDTTKPEDGKTKVRVIHAIPDVGAATVSVEDGPELFALPGFGNASDYAEVDPGTYTLDVTPAGAEDPAFSVEDLSVSPDSTYTAFAVGQASEGTVGAIVTEDSADGEIVAVTGNAPNNSGVGTDDKLVDTSGTGEPLTPPTSNRNSTRNSAALEPSPEDTKKPPEQREAARESTPKDENDKEKTPVESQPEPKPSPENPSPEQPSPEQPSPEKKPSEAAPVDEVVAAQPVSTAPVETAPVETAPVETAPVETAPVETAPVETAPVETAPVAPPVWDHPISVQPTTEYTPPVVPAVPTESVVQDITVEVYASVSQNESGEIVADISVSQAGINVSVPEVVVPEVVVPEMPVYAPPVAPQPIVPQPVVPVAAPVSVPQGGSTGVIPTEVPVQATVNIQAAVINSGARRRFVRGR